MNLGHAFDLFFKLMLILIGDLHQEREQERLELSGLNSNQKKKDLDKKEEIEE